MAREDFQLLSAKKTRPATYTSIIDLPWDRRLLIIWPRIGLGVVMGMQKLHVTSLAFAADSEFRGAPL